VTQRHYFFGELLQLLVLQKNSGLLLFAVAPLVTQSRPHFTQQQPAQRFVLTSQLKVVAVRSNQTLLCRVVFEKRLPHPFFRKIERSR
jgi:hypothetical protein